MWPSPPMLPISLTALDEQIGGISLSVVVAPNASDFAAAMDEQVGGLPSPSLSSRTPPTSPTRSTSRSGG